MGLLRTFWRCENEGEWEVEEHGHARPCHPSQDFLKACFSTIGCSFNLTILSFFNFLQLQLRATTSYYNSQSLIVSSDCPADRLMIIVSGVAELILFPGSHRNRSLHQSSVSLPTGSSLSLDHDNIYGESNLSREGGAGQRKRKGSNEDRGDGFTLLRVISRG